MRFIYLIIISIIVISCKDENKKEIQLEESSLETQQKFNDSKFVISKQFKVGDVRRYGIYPDSTYSLTHPYTKKSKIETVLDLAENQNIELNFPKGFYNFRLDITGRKNINLNFEDAKFAGIIRIFEKDSTFSENITFKGKLTSYEGFFTRLSTNISIECWDLLTDISKCSSKLRNKGCKLYAGTNGFKLNNLYVEDLGSESESYKNNGAALAIEGWNNNPKNVIINNVLIKSSDRHGVYITGTDNSIKKLEIQRFGIGKNQFLSPFGDAAKGEEKEFTALWMNKCDYCFVDKVTIDEKDSKGTNTVFLDAGDPVKESEIGELIILNDNLNIGVKKDPNTNVQIISTVIK